MYDYGHDSAHVMQREAESMGISPHPRSLSSFPFLFHQGEQGQLIKLKLLPKQKKIPPLTHA